MAARSFRVPVVLALLAAAFLLQVASAQAVVRTRTPAPPPAGRSNTNTDLILRDLGSGQSVQGYIANPGNPFDPVADGYPVSNPGVGWRRQDESFAGVILGRPVGGGADLKLYCIDINTETRIGYGYFLGSWDASNVKNVGYVARLLNEYYPNTNEPASLTDLNQKAAAVQAAIWFFSDSYVLSTSDPLRAAVVAIVNKARVDGPLVEPPPPTLTISPGQLSGPAGRVLGPYTVNSSNLARRRHLRASPNATVTATGAEMFSDADATQSIPNGAVVPSGTKIWLRSTGPSHAVLQATAQATVPTGNVYLYDGNSGVADAQRLILAQTATLTTTVQATGDFLAPGSLEVTKTIAGPAAGSQRTVVITVTCDDGVTRHPFVIRRGAAAGDRARTYTDIPVGTVCLVVEKANGSTTGVEVEVTGNGQEATIPSGGTAHVHITDTYRHIGSLLVSKTIAGPAAGQQGAITIHTTCDGTALTPDFVIPAGTPTGNPTKQYGEIPAPATCTVTETADGHTGTVSVVVVGSGQTVSVAPGEIARANLGDTYGLVPGQLQVTKTVAGPLAGQQGEVVVHTVCNGTALAPDLVIPAGSPAGVYSQLYSGIATPASCVSTETADGHTSAVSVDVAGSPQSATVNPAGSGAVNITDTYGSAPGSLLVTKSIGGRLAGSQGRAVIHVVCDGSALTPDFVIPAGSGAGNMSQSFDNIPAGASCTVTETADGSTATVDATVSGSGQTVTIPAGTVVGAHVVNVYHRPFTAGGAIARTGTLRVTKVIAGPAARRRGTVAILVACGPARTFAFLIRPSTRPGRVSRAFADLLPGTRCTVTETADGHNASVNVASRGKHQTVRIRAGRTATVTITDRYSGRVVQVAPAGLG